MTDKMKKPGPLPAPVYALIYPQLREIVRPLGYALAVHGSMATDLDLIAVPWIEEAEKPEKVVEAIQKYVNGFMGWDSLPGDIKAHGRRSWLIWFNGVSSPIGGRCHIDLSIMPTTGGILNE